MSDYAYTYDTRDDEQGFDTLTDAQRTLGLAINAQARMTGEDRAVLLAGAAASGEDKAAVEQAWTAVLLGFDGEQVPA